ncbi:hypothetical protein AAFF_G00301580 [Aldrovandia affinis]|uniref:C2 domain-containing protein n=1 Tax=Aldrovandia affinis TaxID=143900 RepID=A0AAD7SPN3_9TELE|nr:hypothetical protein AAFF_G00301580 [Aldrovandia affinis]
MPHQEEEPLWQSVLFFCCKGAIEGIVVLLFIWLLVQVLFPKHLEVHLQVMLGVGLAVFCFCLILGCVLCWRRGKPHPLDDKEVAMSPPAPPADCVNLTLSSSLPSASLPIRQQYEELAGDVLEYPSPAGGGSPPSPSEDGFAVLASQPRAASELNESCFPLRRLSTPVSSSLPHKPSVHGRASLPSLPSLSKLGLASRTRRALERRCTVTGDSFLYSERSRLTGAAPHSTLQPDTAPEGPQLLLHSGSRPLPACASRCSSPQHVARSASLCSACRGQRAGWAFTRRRSLSPEFQSQSFTLQVGSVDRLRVCTLRLTVFARDFSGLREVLLGDLELPCREIDWEPDYTITFTKELQPAKYKLKKSLSSQDALGQRGPACVPRVLGQLFVLLQYQTQACRIKVMVRKAESLAKMTRMPGVPDHYVVINLRHEGVVIGTKETKGAGGYNAVWNAPFLFDLPPGDVTQLPLVLEFIVMQGRIYTKNSVLGHVLIGCEASETGQTHWRDMCSRGHVETARWHTIQPDLP